MFLLCFICFLAVEVGVFRLSGFRPNRDAPRTFQLPTLGAKIVNGPSCCPDCFRSGYWCFGAPSINQHDKRQPQGEARTTSFFYPLCDPAPIPCSPVTSGTLLQYPPKTVRPQEAVVPPRCQPIPRLCGGLNFFVMVMDFTWIDSSLSTFELSVLICGYVWMDWQWSHVQKKASLIFHWRGQLSQDNYQLQICCICPPDTLPLGANTPTPILHHTHQLFILFHSYLWSFIYMQWIIFLTFSRHPPQSHTSMRYVSAKLFVRIRMLQWEKKTGYLPEMGFNDMIYLGCTCTTSTDHT